MDIILVRHAKSAHDYSRWKTDDIRPLSPIGTERQTKSSLGMQREGLAFDMIWVSPFLRAQQTLEIIQNTYDSDLEPEIVDELQVWGDPSLVKDMLDDHASNHPDSKLLIVGHNPNISNLIELLTGEHIYMKTSDVVMISKKSEWELVTYFPRKRLY